MCNCKGWDIAYYPDHEIVPEQHFCRTFGDCGSRENTLEEAALFIASEYDRLYDYYCDVNNRELFEVDDQKLEMFLEQSKLWRTLQHPTYLYYNSPVDLDAD